MDDVAMTQYITASFAGVETTTAYSYTFFFYDSERKLPFATLASVDNAYDRVSNLDRPGVFRLNIGVRKPTFQALFGTGKVDVTAYDFTALDTIMPHPDYASQSWVCVLTPVMIHFITPCNRYWLKPTMWPCKDTYAGKRRMSPKDAR